MGVSRATCPAGWRYKYVMCYLARFDPTTWGYTSYLYRPYRVAENLRVDDDEWEVISNDYSDFWRDSEGKLRRVRDEDLF